mmetsp:Transcript_60399/g.68863  ORF Transcript_60399/g.68863 Transcript_60399/m.68863 type:complete len:1291 (+) Transcript_60399:41-3913(+)
MTILPLAMLKVALWRHYKMKRGLSKRAILRELLAPIAFSVLLAAAAILDKKTTKWVTPIFLPFTFIQFFRTFIHQVIEERQKRVKEYLKLSGMTNFTYFFAWVLSQALEGLVVSAIITGTLTLFGVTPLKFCCQLILLLWIYSICAVQYGFVLTTFFKDPKLGTQVALLVFQIPFVFTYTMRYYSDFQRHLICLLPQPALDVGFLSIMGEEHVFRHSTTSIKTIIGLLCLAAGLYALLAFYLDQIVPTEYGVAKPWYFPCRLCRRKRRRRERSEIDLELSDPVSLYFNSNPEDADPDTCYYADPRLSSALYQQQSDDPMESDPKLRVELLKKTFGDVVAVDDVTMNIHKNQIFCLLGHNGSGKTTLINLITGFYKPKQGKILLDGEDISKDQHNLRTKMAVCPQSEILLDNLSVEDHLRLVAKVRRVSPTLIESEIHHALSDTNLTQDRSRIPETLSMGKKRCLALAMTLIGGAEVVILDEPTAGLDLTTRQEVWRVLHSIKATRTLILTTHFMEEAEMLADRIGVLTHGKLFCLGDCDFIKRRFGVGYQLSVQLKPEFNSQNALSDIEPRITDIVCTNISDATLRRQRGLLYLLPFNQVEAFGSMFRELERIEEIQLSLDVTSLEEAFVNIGVNEDRLIRAVSESDVDDEANMSQQETGAYLDFFASTFEDQANKGSSSLKTMVQLRLKQLKRQSQTYFRLFIPAIMLFFMLPRFDEHEDDIGYYHYGEYERFQYSYSVLTYMYMFVLPLSLGFYVFIPVNEKESRLRLLFRVDGINSRAYWISVFVNDFLLLLGQNVAILLAIGILYLGNSRWIIASPIVLLITTFGGIAVINFMHFLALTFKHSNDVFKYSFLYQFFGFFILPTALYLVVLLSEVEILKTGIQAFNLVNPMWSMYMTFHSYMGYGTFSQPSIPTAIRIVVLLGIALLYLVLTIHFDLRTKQQPSTVDNLDSRSDIDPSVRAEEERVCGSGCTDDVQVRKLSKKYPGGVQALSEISFGVSKGEVIGLLGPNGAGKTTALDIITSHIPSSSGDVQFTSLGDGAESIGICPQASPLCVKLTVEEHLLMVASVKGLSLSCAQKQVDSLLQNLRLSEYRQRYAENLSGGNKRKLLVAMTLVAGVKLQILDEPTTGIDPLSRRVIWDLCSKVASRKGISIILATNMMEEAEMMCDKIGILVNGRLQALGSPNELRERWGTGFRLSVDLAKTTSSDAFDLTARLKEVVPQTEPVLTESAGLTTKIFHLKTERISFHQMFELLQNLKDQDRICHYSFKRSTVQDIYTHFAREQTL